MLTLDEFIKQWAGVQNAGDTDANKGQCTGISELWLDNLNLPHIWGDAKDLLQNADTRYVDVTDNSPTNAPLPGDIVVWGASWGAGFGHTGVVTQASSDSFSAFEQNNPVGHAPVVIVHPNYNGVLGWLHIKALAPDQQATLDELRTARDNNWNLYQEEVAKNTALTGQLGELQHNYETDQKEIVTLNDSLSKLTANDKDYQNQIIAAEHARDDYKNTLVSLYNALGASDLASALSAIDLLQKPVDEAVKPVLKERNDLYKLLFEEGLGVYKKYIQKSNLGDKLLHWFR